MMKDENKTKNELIKELKQLRRQVARLDKSESERKRAGQALRESESKFKRLYDSNTIGIIFWDTAGNITQSNSEFLRMVGYTEDEVISGKVRWRDLTPPEYAPLDDKALEEMARTGICTTFEKEYIRKDGSRVPIVLGAAILEGQKNDGICFVLDITERKRAEEVLRESERKLKDAQRLGQIGHWSFDPGTGRVAWAEVVFEIYERDSKLGPPTEEDEAAYYSPEDARRLRDYARRTIETGEPYEADVRVRLPGGRSKDVVAIGAPVMDTRGRVVGLAGTVQDITERKRAEEALRASDRKHRTLLENLPQKIFLKDRQSVYVTCNENYARDLKITPEEIAGKTDYDFYPKDLADKYRADDKRLMDAEKTEDIQEKYIQGGRETWVHTFKTPVKDERGAVVGLLGIFRDITERKRAEEALREREEKYRALFENAPGSILIFDMAGKVLDANEYFKIPRQLNVGKHFLEMGTIHPDDHEFVKQQFGRLISGGKESGSIELRLFADTPNPRWVELHAAMLKKEGKPYAIQTISVDITERKRAEERIVHLNRVLRAIRNVNQLIVREKDPERLIHEACGLVVEHRGYSSALIILADKAGTPLTYAEAGVGEAFGPLAESLRKGILPPCCEKAHIHDGVYLVTDRNKVCASCPMFTANQLPNNAMCVRLKHGENIYGYLAVSGDKVIGMDAEEQSLFAEMAGDIAFALNSIEQGKAIQRAETEHERIEAAFRQAQKMEAVGRLAGGVAHDFNNMLAVILGYAGAAMSDLDSHDPLYEDLFEIKDAAQRSVDLTRQLLAFSRKQLMEPKVINLNEVIANQKKMLGRMIGEDIDLKFVPSGDIWNVMIDPSQIDQILANLVVNARDAIPGVGTVIIETANVTLDETYSQRHVYAKPGEYVMLAVSDNGAGIDPDTLEHIFEPFFTTKGKGQGTGLGLSTVYGIVKQNEGLVNAYSEPAMGTTFKIYFPRYKGVAPATAEKAKSITLTGTETVLIVEDEEQVMKLARRVLEQYGYKVMTASKPGDACLLVEKYEGDIHLLLTDVVMPLMNGKELQGRIAKLKPGIKTLFMSGYTANIIAHHGVIEEGVYFIQKPFSAEALAAKVREALDS